MRLVPNACRTPWFLVAWGLTRIQRCRDRIHAAALRTEQSAVPSRIVTVRVRAGGRGPDSARPNRPEGPVDEARFRIEILGSSPWLEPGRRPSRSASCSRCCRSTRPQPPCCWKGACAPSPFSRGPAPGPESRAYPPPASALPAGGGGGAAASAPGRDSDDPRTGTRVTPEPGLGWRIRVIRAVSRTWMTRIMRSRRCPDSCHWESRFKLPRRRQPRRDSRR
jgi:hypothetical protein